MFCEFYFQMFVSFFGHPLGIWHMEAPSPGTESEPELQPTPQLQQCHIFSPLCRVGDQTSTSTETNWIMNPWHHSRNFYFWIFIEVTYYTIEICWFTLCPEILVNSLVCYSLTSTGNKSICQLRSIWLGSLFLKKENIDSVMPQF